MKPTSCLLPVLALLALASGGDLLAAATTPTAATRTAPAASERSSRFTFSLLPKSFQRRPSLDFHVITELTAEGKKVTPPTSTKPVYYIAQPGKFSQMGNNTPAGEQPPDLEQLTRAMEGALASGHYLKASPATPLPAIAVVFNYGSFARFSMAAYDFQEDQMLAQLADQMNDEAARSGTESQASSFYSGPMARPEERDTNSLLPIVLAHKAERDDVLRRAALIGGEKFARELGNALNEEAKYQTGRNGLGFGSVDTSSPFHQFMNANENLMMLVEDSFSGCYFVIASAFDYRAMQKGQRVLLWRTKMTVNASGISMAESLPPLVLTAGPYLGKEMPDPVTLTRRIFRDGKVEVGTPRVVDEDVALPNSTPPAAATSAPPAKPAAAPATIAPATAK